MECKGQWHRGPWHFGNIARSHIIYTRSYSWPDKQVHMYTFYWKSFQVSLYSHRQRRGLLIYACAAAARALSGRMLETIAFLDGRASHHFQTLLQARPHRIDCGADVPGDDNVKIRLVLHDYAF